MKTKGQKCRDEEEEMRGRRERENHKKLNNLGDVEPEYELYLTYLTYDI